MFIQLSIYSTIVWMIVFIFSLIPAGIFNFNMFILNIQAEIEKVKKRREERALEKAQHEEEMVSLLLMQTEFFFFSWEIC